MRLHVGVLRTEQLFCSLDGQAFGYIDVFAPAIVALAGVALSVLIGEYRALRLQDGAAHVILGGDKLDLLSLATLFRPYRGVHVWIYFLQRLVPPVITCLGR